MILSSRPKDDDSKDGFTKWPFMTTHTWAENPRGKWLLEVSRFVGLFSLILRHTLIKLQQEFQKQTL